MSLHPLFRTAIFGAALVLHSLSVHAQTAYPSRPIKVIVHTTAGSASDATARLIADHLSRRLGQPLVIDNRAGAGGAIGVEAAAKAAPDGYTLLSGASSVMIMLPAVSKRKLPYDADSDFVPIMRVASAPFVLVVNANSKIKTFKDLVSVAKAEPGRLSYASAGPATNPHMLGEMLSALTGTSMLHVPYKGPSAAQVDLLAGTVDMQFDTPSATVEHIRAGRLVPLLVTGSKRVSSLPDVPTVGELGYPQLMLTGWNGLYAPKGTSPEIIKTISDALLAAMKTAALRDALIAMGTEPDILVGNDLLKEQKTSRETWKKLAEARGLQLD